MEENSKKVQGWIDEANKIKELFKKYGFIIIDSATSFIAVNSTDVVYASVNNDYGYGYLSCLVSIAADANSKIHLFSTDYGNDLYNSMSNNFFNLTEDEITYFFNHDYCSYGEIKYILEQQFGKLDE